MCVFLCCSCWIFVGRFAATCFFWSVNKHTLILSGVSASTDGSIRWIFYVSRILIRLTSKPKRILKHAHGSTTSLYGLWGKGKHMRLSSRFSLYIQFASRTGNTAFYSNIYKNICWPVLVCVYIVGAGKQTINSSDIMNSVHVCVCVWYRGRTFCGVFPFSNICIYIFLVYIHCKGWWTLFDDGEDAHRQHQGKTPSRNRWWCRRKLRVYSINMCCVCVCMCLSELACLYTAQPAGSTRMGDLWEGRSVAVVGYV